VEGTIRDKQPGAAGTAGVPHGIPGWAGARGWLLANTFTPAWMTGRWRHPAASYVVAVVLQVVALAVVVGLVQILPGFPFPGALPILAVVVAALGWGTGPSLLATLVGALLLVVLILPPGFSVGLDHVEDVAGIVLYTMIGVTISISAGHSARARRGAEALAGQVQSIVDVVPDPLAIHDAQGAIVRLNRAGQQVWGPQRSGDAPASGLHTGDVRTREGAPFLAPELPVARALRDETVCGVEIHCRDANGRERTMEVSAAPFRTVEGRVLGVVSIMHDVTAHRQAEHKAAARAQEVEAIFEAMTDGVAVYDVRGSLLHANTALRTLLAFDRDPAYSARPFPERVAVLAMRDTTGRLLAPDESVQARVLRGEVLTGANAVDVLVRSLDGRELELSVSGAPMRDDAGRIAGAVLVVRDVTQRRRLERYSHEALDALVAMAEVLVSSDDSIAAEDMENTAPGTHAVGHRICELTRSVLGCQRVSITALDPETGVRRALAVVGLTPEQEHARQAADQRDERTDPALVARLQAGEVVIIDMTQPPFSERPNPYGARTVLVAPMRVGEHLVGFLALDYGGLVHEYTPGEIALAGTIAKLAAFVLERERLQRERAAAQAAELALRETNHRMNEFLSIVSHELRSPLTSALGNIQLAERRGQRLAAGADAAGVADQISGVLELLERARHQINRQNRLVGDLLDVSRVGANKLELQPAPCDLAAIVCEVVEEQRQAAPGRTIDLDLAAESIPVVADADRIAQVVTNFLTNALKYSPADRPVAVGLRVEDGAARVWVRDQGPGLSAADQVRIWEPFYRAVGIAPQSGSGAGLGLGLHISKTLVERHQGQVGVDSAPSQGSTFWFTLPVASSQ
jgi:PAS domain S-box-containing protein